MSPSSSGCVCWADKKTEEVLPRYSCTKTPTEFLQLLRQEVHMTFSSILLSAEDMMCLQTRESFAQRIIDVCSVRWKFLPGNQDPIFWGRHLLRESEGHHQAWIKNIKPTMHPGWQKKFIFLRTLLQLVKIQGVVEFESRSRPSSEKLCQG